MNSKIIKISLIFFSFILFLGSLGNEHSPLSFLFESRNLQAYSSPLAFLFQIMFILFFISPPIIAFMLFMIWKELRERNKMK